MFFEIWKKNIKYVFSNTGSDESMRLHCEFGVFIGAPADDIRDAVFNNFYSRPSIGITK